MKTKTFLLTLLVVLTGFYSTLARVGIGTTDPKTTLQVAGDPVTTTIADGIQGPSLSLAQLDAKITAYGTDQDGAIVYIDDVTTASTVTEKANITTNGCYNYDASNDVWKTIAKDPTTYFIGDFAQGGIVFWVDETGQHGLVAAKADQSTGVGWYRAAGICNELEVTEGGKTYSDWYLPSEKELLFMFHNHATIDSTAGANGGSSFSKTYDLYWSSDEKDDLYASAQGFGVRAFQKYVNKYSKQRVRAVRAF